MKMTDSPNGKRMPSTEKLICHASSTLKSKIMCSSRMWRSTTTQVRASRSCTTKILMHMIIRLATPSWTAPDLAQEMLGRASQDTVAISKLPGSVSRRLRLKLQHANFYPRPIIRTKTAWSQAETHQNMPETLSGSHQRSSTPQGKPITIQLEPVRRRAWNSFDWTWLRMGRLRKQELPETSPSTSTRPWCPNWDSLDWITRPLIRVSRGPRWTSRIRTHLPRSLASWTAEIHNKACPT